MFLQGENKVTKQLNDYANIKKSLKMTSNFKHRRDRKFRKHRKTKIYFSKGIVKKFRLVLTRTEQSMNTRK